MLCSLTAEETEDAPASALLLPGHLTDGHQLRRHLLRGALRGLPTHSVPRTLPTEYSSRQMGALKHTSVSHWPRNSSRARITPSVLPTLVLHPCPVHSSTRKGFRTDLNPPPGDPSSQLHGVGGPHHFTRLERYNISTSPGGTLVKRAGTMERPMACRSGWLQTLFR